MFKLNIGKTPCSCTEQDYNILG